MKDDEQAHPFAIVPVEVMMDNRLTLETMRVLVTLFSFRNKVTGLAFPKRERISERCGMHPSNISAATTKLVELGWLVKTGVGGYSKATKYEIQVPEIVAQQATVYKDKVEARKVAQSATVAQPTTVVDSATRHSSPIGYTQRTDQLTDNKPSLSEDSDKKSIPVDDQLQTACKATWKSYDAAYQKRYNEPATRNAHINTSIKAFCKRVPHHEAPQIAAFFVSLDDNFYVQSVHSVAVMLKNAEGLRTRWATGRTKISTKNEKFDAFAYVNRNAIQPGERIEKPIN